jgi:hypothetical protein
VLLIPAFAILHYLANNLVFLRAHEAIVPGAVIMAGVTVVFFVLRYILKGAAPAALLTGLLGIAFFSFGHIYVTPEDQPDSRYLLGLGIPVILGLMIFLRGRSGTPHTIGRVLNIASAILLVAPLYQISAVYLTASAFQDGGDLKEPLVSDERLSEVKAKLDPAAMPDIYYIILDGYPRSGSPASFDNSAFIGELEDRGFYVDPQARSNYKWTSSSTTSSLNMRYLDIIVTSESPATDVYKVYNVMLDHALGKILTGLGYEYIHVASGWFMTKTSRNADLVVDFTPEGRTESGYNDVDPISHYPYTFENAVKLPNRFTTHFLQTSFAKYFERRPCLLCAPPGPYGWWHPLRSLAWIDYMHGVGKLDSPKFVFTHLVKPHFPYSFDQHGHISQEIDPDGKIRFTDWKDGHDPEVGGPFYGQIAWLNSQILNVIDSILSESDKMPIIVLTSDHGHIPDINAPNNIEGIRNINGILAAYLLPDGGANMFYSGITSANVFRVLLNFYFGLNVKLLDDVVF